MCKRPVTVAFVLGESRIGGGSLRMGLGLCCDLFGRWGRLRIFCDSCGRWGRLGRLRSGRSACGGDGARGGEKSCDGAGSREKSCVGHIWGGRERSRSRERLGEGRRSGEEKQNGEPRGVPQRAKEAWHKKNSEVKARHRSVSPRRAWGGGTDGVRRCVCVRGCGVRIVFHEHSSRGSGKRRSSR